MKGKKYVIPVLNIQDVLLNIRKNKKFIKLITKIEDYINSKEYKITYKVTFNLERQWYPVFHTKDIYLADKIIKWTGKNKH